MVTDLFKIETDAKLAASDNYHETALECGLVQFHCQGYKDGWYKETVEALNKAVKSLYPRSDFVAAPRPSTKTYLVLTVRFRSTL